MVRVIECPLVLRGPGPFDLFSLWALAGILLGKVVVNGLVVMLGTLKTGFECKSLADLALIAPTGPFDIFPLWALAGI